MFTGRTKIETNDNKRIFDAEFPYKLSYFEQLCLLAKMVAKTVKRPIKTKVILKFFIPLIFLPVILTRTEVCWNTVLSLSHVCSSTKYLSENIRVHARAIASPRTISAANWACAPWGPSSLWNRLVCFMCSYKWINNDNCLLTIIVYHTLILCK